MAKNRVLLAYIAGLLAWGFVLFIALKVGSVADADPEIIYQLRLPRALLASAVGMGLAVAGAGLQALFTNPLCEPYTLGVSSGATLGAVVGAFFGLTLAFSGLAGASFAGAVAFAAILYFISVRMRTTNLTLLLAGVMLQFLGSSFVALFIALSDANGLQGVMFWLLGDLSRARLSGAIFSLVGVAVLTLAVWRNWRSLDALLMGEEGAAALGVEVRSVRRNILFLTSLLVGICVSGGGMIGFVGLVVPHFCRRLVGSLHFKLVPLCALWGAAALVGADSLARVLARPIELPVGVVTALIGAPIFMWVILQRRGAR